MEYLKALGIVIAAVVLVYKLIDIFVAKLGGLSTLEVARKLVADVVHFVEQTMDAPGETKKAKAIELAQQALEYAGIELDAKTLDLFIEAAVFAMNLILKK